MVTIEIRSCNSAMGSRCVLCGGHCETAIGYSPFAQFDCAKTGAVCEQCMEAGPSGARHRMAQFATRLMLDLVVLVRNCGEDVVFPPVGELERLQTEYELERRGDDDEPWEGRGPTQEEWDKAKARDLEGPDLEAADTIERAERAAKRRRGSN